MEKILSLSETKSKLNHLVEEVLLKDDSFVITKNGTPAAVLVSSALYEGWKETEEIKKDSDLMKEIKKGVQKLKRKGKRFSFEDVFGESLK